MVIFKPHRKIRPKNLTETADEAGAAPSPTPWRGYSPSDGTSSNRLSEHCVCIKGQLGRESLTLSGCQLSSVLRNCCLPVLLFTICPSICSFAHLNLVLPSVFCPWTQHCSSTWSCNSTYSPPAGLALPPPGLWLLASLPVSQLRTLCIHSAILCVVCNIWCKAIIN